MSNSMIPNRSGGRWASMFTAIVGTAVVLMIQGIIFGVLDTLGLQALLGMQFAFTAERFMAALATLSPAGRDAVLVHYPWDFAMLAMYAAAGYALLHLLLTPKPRGFQRLAVSQRVSLMYTYRGMRQKQWLRFLPVVAGASDLGENVLQLALLQGVVPVGTPLVLAASLLSCLKFAFLAASVAVGVWTLLERFSSRHFKRG